MVILCLPAVRSLVRRLKIQLRSELSYRKKGLKGLGGESLMAAVPIGTSIPVVRFRRPTICGGMARVLSKLRPPQLIVSFIGRVFPSENGLGGEGNRRMSSSGFKAAIGE